MAISVSNVIKMYSRFRDKDDRDREMTARHRDLTESSDNRVIAANSRLI